MPNQDISIPAKGCEAENLRSLREIFHYQ